MRSTLNRALAVTAAALALTAATAAPVAAAGGRVGPHQWFVGLVDGGNGAGAPVVIHMNCAGPVHPGETAHPLPGQTLSLRRVARTTAGAGHTGPHTGSVGAFFGVLPPRASAGTRGWVDFIAYGTRPLPTSLTLPCSGSSTVYFVPLPTVPGGATAAVPVVYAGQP